MPRWSWKKMLQRMNFRTQTRTHLMELPAEENTSRFQQSEEIIPNKKETAEDHKDKLLQFGSQNSSNNIFLKSFYPDGQVMTPRGEIIDLEDLDKLIDALLAETNNNILNNVLTAQNEKALNAIIERGEARAYLIREAHPNQITLQETQLTTLINTAKGIRSNNHDASAQSGAKKQLQETLQPFDADSYKKHIEQLPSWLQGILQPINKADADAMLAQQEAGMFLLRPRIDGDGLVLSVKLSGNQVQHINFDAEPIDSKTIKVTWHPSVPDSSINTLSISEGKLTDFPVEPTELSYSVTNLEEFIRLLPVAACDYLNLLKEDQLTGLLTPQYLNYNYHLYTRENGEIKINEESKESHYVSADVLESNEESLHPRTSSLTKK